MLEEAAHRGRLGGWEVGARWKYKKTRGKVMQEWTGIGCCGNSMFFAKNFLFFCTQFQISRGMEGNQKRVRDQCTILKARAGAAPYKSLSSITIALSFRLLFNFSQSTPARCLASFYFRPPKSWSLLYRTWECPLPLPQRRLPHSQHYGAILTTTL